MVAPDLLFEVRALLKDWVFLLLAAAALIILIWLLRSGEYTDDGGHVVRTRQENPLGFWFHATVFGALTVIFVACHFLVPVH